MTVSRTARDADTVFTLRGIQDMLGLSRRAILAFVAAGFVTPTRGPRNTYRFSFQDVVLLRTAQSLRAADIPTRRVLRSLKRLRDQLPASLPLTGLRIAAIGDDVVLREGGQSIAVESGQLLFDFSVARIGDVLTFPGPAALASPELTADDALELGATLHEAGAFDDALAAYEHGLAHRPDHADLLYNRAIVLEDLDRIDEALAAYAACLRVAPDFADAHWNLARLYEQCGIAQQALRHFSAFRRLQR